MRLVGLAERIIRREPGSQGRLVTMLQGFLARRGLDGLAQAVPQDAQDAGSDIGRHIGQIAGGDGIEHHRSSVMGRLTGTRAITACFPSRN